MSLDRLEAFAGKRESDVGFFTNSVEITESMLNGKVYNGSESKFGITIDGINYVVKEQKKDWLNVQCELVGSRLIEKLGGNVHKTYPGIYNGKQVVLCKDFTQGKGKLKSLSTLSSSSIDTFDDNHEYYLEDVFYELTKVRGLDTLDAMTNFYKMFIFDAIIGNSDRHKGNWGILSLSKSKHEMAPIFDNGAGLFPRNRNFVIDSNWMEERTLVFPNSKIMFCKKPFRERTSYYEVCQSAEIPNSIKVWAKSLDPVRAMEAVCKDLGIDALQTSYYKTIVFHRFTCIIKGEGFKWQGMI